MDIPNQKLKAKMHDVGYSSSDFARDLDVHRSSVKRKLWGEISMTEDELRTLARGLKMPFNVFLAEFNLHVEHKIVAKMMPQGRDD